VNLQNIRNYEKEKNISVNCDIHKLCKKMGKYGLNFGPKRVKKFKSIKKEKKIQIKTLFSLLSCTLNEIL